MSTKLTISSIVLLTLLASAAPADVINSNWVGTDGYWNNPANWDPPIVPDNNATNTFSVTIDGGSGDKKHVYVLQNRTVNQVATYGNVWLESRTPDSIELVLDDVNGLRNYGNLRIRGGSYNERAELTIYGTGRNESGATVELFGVTFEDEFYNASGGNMAVKYENIFPGGIQNHGFIGIDAFGEMSADGNIVNTGQVFIGGGTFAATGLISNDANGLVKGFGVVASKRCENHGQILAFGGSLIVGPSQVLLNNGTIGNAPLSVLHIAQDLDNLGRLESGLRGAVTIDGNMTNESSGIVSLHDGSLVAKMTSQTDGATFEGFGGITGKVQIDPNAVIKVTGPTNIVGDVNIPANATLEISDGQTLITGHTTCDGTIHLKGGTVIFQGGCDCEDCTIINEAGADRNHFDINADGTVDLKDFDALAHQWLWQASWY